MYQFEKMKELIIAVKDRFGPNAAREVIFNEGQAKRLGQIDESRWEAVIARCEEMLEKDKKPKGRPRKVAPARKTEMPEAIAAPYGGTPERQFCEKVQGAVIDTREKAIAYIAELQRKWDLVDENEQLKLLMEKMEERHGDEFNAFFEATIRQVMVGSGMTEVRINTAEVLKTLVESKAVRVREVPGFLIYELAEDVPDADVH